MGVARRKVTLLIRESKGSTGVSSQALQLRFVLCDVDRLYLICKQCEQQEICSVRGYDLDTPQVRSRGGNLSTVYLAYSFANGECF